MTDEKLAKLFVRTIVILARVQDKIKDEFYARKFYFKMEELMLEFLAGNNSEGDVAQYIKDKNLFRVIDSTLELVDICDYAKVTDSPVILLAKKCLLDFKLKLFAVCDAEESLDKGIVGPKAKPTPLIRANEPRPEKARYGNANNDVILRCLAEVSQARSRDLVEKVGTMSERTIMRHLKDMVSIGLVDKFEKDRSIFYTVKKK